MKLKLWGTRGSLPSPDDDADIRARIKDPHFDASRMLYTYGGNTTCLEVIVDTDERYVFDAGSGARSLAQDMLKDKSTTAKVFLTHLHWDHIQGLPFFVPGYMPNCDVTVYGRSTVNQAIRAMGSGQDVDATLFKDMVRALQQDLPEDGSLKHVLAMQMYFPFFPVPMTIMKGLKNFVDVEPHHEYSNGIVVDCIEGSHPNGSYVYKIQSGGKKVVFATDYEHDGQITGEDYGPKDLELIEFCKGTDVLIYDGQYLPAVYVPFSDNELRDRIDGIKADHNKNSPGAFDGLDAADQRSILMRNLPMTRIGWGHSTYEKGADIAYAAGVPIVVYTHHDPASSAKRLDDIAALADEHCNARRYGVRTMMAYDGMELDIGDG